MNAETFKNNWQQKESFGPNKLWKGNNFYVAGNKTFESVRNEF